MKCANAIAPEQERHAMREQEDLRADSLTGLLVIESSWRTE